MVRNGKTLGKTLVVALMISSLTACGTILYPERKGQIQGRIDPAVLALNGVGLLFYLIPGVIAFAVDFSNGTIYLPNGRHRFSDNAVNNPAAEMTSMEVIRLNRPLSPEELPQQLKQHSALPLNWQQAVVSDEAQAVAWLAE